MHQIIENHQKYQELVAIANKYMAEANILMKRIKNKIATSNEYIRYSYVMSQMADAAIESAKYNIAYTDKEKYYKFISTFKQIKVNSTVFLANFN